MFDLDGVVYLGTEVIPGAAAAIQSTVDAGVPVAYVTNNASRRAGEVGSLLRSLGVPARDDEVITSGRAAAELLAAELPAASPVLVVGTDALREELRSCGLTPVTGVADGPVAVVQGYGPGVGWAQLAEACLCVRAGARWVATNTDATMPSPRGVVPGNGSMVAALATALGRGPDVVVGKPESALFQVAAGGRDAGRVLFVGDRLDTDIEGARRAGMDSLLVLTGVSQAREVLRAAPDERPTYLAADLAALSGPRDGARIPPWQDGRAVSGGWHVTLAGDRLVLGGPEAAPADASTAGSSTADPATSDPGTGDSSTADAATSDALRALAAAAWAHPEWTVIEPAGATAAQALRDLGWQATAGGA